MLKRTLYLTWRSLGWLTRALLVALTAIGFLFATAVLGLRYWVLPNIGNYREFIARTISDAAGQRVTIGRIDAQWDGMRPHLILLDVALLDRNGQPLLHLAQTETSLSWLPLLLGEVRFDTIEFTGPSLEVRRDNQGTIYVGGIAVTGGAGGSGFAEWLSRQRRIVIRDARIAWDDELRGALPLVLGSVQFRLENDGDRHRFGLHAAPPPDLAAPLDLRGDLRGASLDSLESWSGQLFAQLDYANLEAWRAWIPYPIALTRGAGALRVWLSFTGPVLQEMTADVRLKDVRTRIGRQSPELDLAGLRGRLAWRTLERGFEVSTDDLALATRTGLVMAPTDFLLRLSHTAGGKPGAGEMRANTLDLGTLVTLSDYLPLDPTVHQRLLDFAPRGMVEDLQVKWTGEWPTPDGYSAKGRFTDLAMRPQGKIPGFSGVTGSLEGDNKGGNFSVSSRHATVELPLVFRAPLEFDSLTAQANWARNGSDFELKLSNVAFANNLVTGSVHGTYRGAPNTRGYIDLNGNVTRADVRFVGAYVPVVMKPTARTWLDKAFVAGGSDDVRLRIKGNLDDFPFRDSTTGVFEVAAKLTGVTLAYAEGWPNIENIAGDLIFRGQRMDLTVGSATSFGARLARVRAAIPDLRAANPVVEVDGEAAGLTSEFLKFVEASPVDEQIDGFTRGLSVAGTGRLALKLRIPLGQPERIRVTGTYDFLANSVELGHGIPTVEQFNGALEFTESTVSLPRASAVVLGGPLTLRADSQRDGSVRVSGTGRLNMDGVRRSFQQPVFRLLRGTADWQGEATLRKGNTDLSIQSSLVGLASDLPAPLAKTATEAIPLRFERRAANSQRYNLTGNYGHVVGWNLLARSDAESFAVERGAVIFGASPALPERKGIWVSGAVGQLELDAWRAVLASGRGSGGVELAGLDLRVDMLDFLGKRFNDIQVNASRQQGGWQARVAGQEITGDMQWRTEGRGRIIGRFKKLNVPAEAPVRPVIADSPVAVRDYPALDVMADSFGVHDKLLGKLELVAEPREREWRVERLKVSNPEGVFEATGQVQGEPASRTQFKLTLEMVDCGKLLARLGYAGALKWGNGKLEGNLTWLGAPYSIDYPSLTGSLKLDAHKGQFLKIEPGASKLLGILSLQSLPRRFLLDFRDVVDSGFEFDSINANATVNKGILSTSDFTMIGSSGRVTMKGDVNLAAETQDLHLRIAPSMSEGVSIAGSLVGGPVVGAATLLMSKVLKDPIGQIASVEYNVTGTWADPVVSKAVALGPRNEK
jgi:uncharacterized protein (TIGR02099 family)